MANKIYDYLTPGDYVFDSSKVEVSGGLAQLKVTPDYTGLVGYWKFEDNALDGSGQGNDGTVYGATYVDGKVGRCLSFDGNDYVDLGNGEPSNITGDMTVSMWVKTNSTPALSRFIANRLGLSGWDLYISASGDKFAYQYSVNSSTGWGISSTNIIDGVWHNITAVRTGSNTLLYLDGNPEPKSSEGALAGDMSTSDNTFIGSLGGSSNYFSGLIDEVAVYNRALSLSEIQGIYNSGIGRHLNKYPIDKPTIEPTNLFDPSQVVTWDLFLETLGGGNQGSIGYNLYKVDKSNKYYWNGSAWVTGGDSDNYNSQAVINTNMGSFDGSPDKIGFIAYLISDGEQQVEVDENQITYTANIAPLLNAGSDKSLSDAQTISPFSDCSFSDPTSGGSIDHAYYDIEGSGWTEILIGAYGTLQEAVQAFNYQFNNIGDITCNLKVEDNEGATSEDSLIVHVNYYHLTFNVKDSQGNHIANIYFKPGDGTGYQVKNSPFIYEYEYNAGGYDIVLDKGGYGIQAQNIPSTDHTENFTLISLIDTSDFLDRMKRLLGLSQENYRIINPSYDGNSNLISATIKTYPTKADANADTNVMATYTMTASYNVNNEMIDYKCVKE